MRRKSPIKNLVCLALLVALQVVLSRFLSIQTPVVKIGFAFIPVMLAGVMFGPGDAALVGGLSDVVGAILFPFGSYFPGYTITAALSGAIYGFALYTDKEKIRIHRIVIAYLLTTLIVTLGLNSLFIAFQNEMMVEGGFSFSRMMRVYLTYVPTRLTQAGIMLAIQVAITVLLLDILKIDYKIMRAVYHRR
ncbi:MAG: folate family ECF transporter S component [Clostridia bacterium]|nr:folate family ECF transporter S component [Clostridia bacterium]